MGLWKHITRHMVAKVFTAIGIGIGIALIVQAYADAGREAQTLKSETRKWAENIAQLFISAVEHSMREGDGIKVEESIEDLKGTIHDAARVRIYDQRGIEVFGSELPPPPRWAIPDPVAAILDAPARRVTEDGRIFRPVLNQSRCHKCHDSDSVLRGVIEIDLAREEFQAMREEEFSRIITAGFIHIMTARREYLLDDYFAEIVRYGPSVETVAVFNADADLRYGAEIAGLDTGQVKKQLRRGSQVTYLPRDDRVLALVPLPMQDRCVACHKDDRMGDIRGVLAMSLKGTAAGEDQAERELENILETSLHFIMLSELGRRIADFLDAVAAGKAVQTLVLYDDQGRQYWTTRHPEPPADVAAVLASGQTSHRYVGSGMDESLLAIAPLRNSPECVQCHGSNSALRGVISVQVSTEIAEMTRASSIRRRIWFTAASLLGILAMLGGLLHFLVARPVKRISDVAQEVGNGNLSVTVERADPDGDEVARLGQHINEMVRGLRTKMHLEKFVSRGAAQAAAGAGLTPLDRTGERRAVTVLFSDIRGFTAYSEKVAPEVVVEMLNRLLRAQAEVVVDYGGDIDKYVGDELMAVFTGDNAETRAVMCAVRMIDAVGEVRKEGETLTVGVGIAAGDVVYGAVGHEERMDFTVIGDVVNTGARLCSAAGGDEVLISIPVRTAVGDVPGLRFASGTPLDLKGKQDPFPVYKVER
ncbi:MAG: HAMP domain-containing protein [Proteobacteria bacterium]|nr:HAMP domain-containing protein [Pseudomonadota bacterium]